MTEFKRHDITPEVLQLQQERINTFTHQTPKEMSLVSKLSDLTYIYEHLIAALADRYIDAEDRLDLLIQQIEKSEEIKIGRASCRERVKIKIGALEVQKKEERRRQDRNYAK